MKKLISILAGIILSLTSGCSDIGKFIDSIPPNPPPNPKLEPIIPEKEKVSYEEIGKRGNIVADSLEKNFPEGLVVYIKGNSPEQNRYVAIRVLREGARTLELTLYRTSESNEKLKEFYLYDQDERHILYEISAQRDLEEMYDKKAFFFDVGINGLGKEKKDYAKTAERGKEEITLSESRLTSKGKTEENKKENLEDLWDTTNITYLSCLKSLTSD